MTDEETSQRFVSFKHTTVDSMSGVL